MPSGREISSAKFSDGGHRIQATLNFPARRAIFPCAKFFDDATVALIGPTAHCLAAKTSLVVILRKGASIEPTNSLTIRTGQTVLKDVLGGPYTGSVVVDTCDACTAPESNLVYPFKLSSGCGGTVGDAEFDATYSVDVAGRALVHAWSIDENACYRATSSDAFGTSSDCTTLKNLIDAAGYVHCYTQLILCLFSPICVTAVRGLHNIRLWVLWGTMFFLQELRKYIECTLLPCSTCRL